ncbi:hypothetical protein [Leifsonia sp. AG29]|uniref:hypothetical protein n=1 Tax=Leifsonia sp. AG29 TaxID=2598860 RepID=UPI00131B664B|nr:hypothetical protein [Leifsonia sp. AG29]
MKRVPVQLALGVLVLCAGTLLLLDATGVRPSPAWWAAVLAAAGVTFAYVFFADRASWWAAIPSAALFGASAATLMDLDRGGLAQWTEVPLLGALGIGFLAVYLRDHRHWWALIPAGILVTLAVVPVLGASVPGSVAGAAFLGGAALTFALVAVLPGGGGSRWWAWIPAGVLAIGAVMVLLSVAGWVAVLNVVWPIAVIAAGAFLIWRALRRRRHPEDESS